MPVRFDDSLPTLVKAVSSAFPLGTVEQAVFLREGSGRLSVVLPEELSEGDRERLTKEMRGLIGAYLRDDAPLRGSHDVGAAAILAEGSEITPVACAGYQVRLIDRRIVGSDWLSPPVAANSGVPRVIFSSLKGGVGRSTALAVASAYLSSRGKRVLAVDLDLEAPGLGNMLLSKSIVPTYGVLDYLVENGISGIDDAFLEDMMAPSYLGEAGGSVTVLPAIGSATDRYPENALSKISRAYLDDFSNGEKLTFTNQVQELVGRLSDGGRFDVILIDARAGLHETTAASLLGLGGEVLLFGVDEPQTFSGYRLLLAHLARFPSSPEDDWRDRFQFVHAKSSADLRKQRDADIRFSDLSRILFPLADFVDVVPNLGVDDFDLVWENEGITEIELRDEPPPILRIMDDSRYSGFDPLGESSLMTAEIFRSTFASLLDWCDAVVGVEEIEDGD